MDARWRGGVLTEAVIRADRGGRCRVRYGSTVKDLQTRAGGSYTLRFPADRGADQSVVVTPLAVAGSHSTVRSA